MSRNLLAAGLLLSSFALRPSSFALAQCAPNFLVQTFNNPAPETADALGYSVAVSDVRTVAGAPYDSPGGVANAGAAFVFNNATGALVATLNNPNPTVDDNFGWSVDIKGTIAVVGAWQDDPPEVIPAGAGVGAPVTNAGAAYVFDATTGALLLTLTKPIPATSDSFGRSVAISDTGNLIIVGADWDDPGGVPTAGAAYVFNAATGALVSTLAKPSPGVAEVFGWSVDISGDLAVVGAYLVNVDGKLRVGEAYVFNAATGALVSTLLDPEPDQDDYFGMSVAISGNTVLVGGYGQAPGGTRTAGTAYVFDAATGVLQRTFTAANAEPDSKFGNSVAIDGNVGVIGGYGYTRQVTIFDASNGAPLGVINPPPPFGGGFFGDYVAISGNSIAAGLHQEDLNLAGTAYLFGCPPPPTPTPTPTPTDTPSPSPTLTPVRTATPSPTPTPIPCLPSTPLRTLNARLPIPISYYGGSVAISGNTAVVGAFNESVGKFYATGAVYVMDADTGAMLRILNNPTTYPSDYFGYSVAIDRNYIVVGAPYDSTDGKIRTGAAYVFDTLSGTLLATLRDPLGSPNGQFGFSVAISGDLAVVGAYGVSADGKINQSGAAYVFDAPTGYLVATLNNPTPGYSDDFGYAVAIDGNLAVVGAHYDDPGGIIDAGTAYVFDAAGGSLLATLNNPEPSINDQFGGSVAIYGNLAVAGAWGNDPGGAPGAGAAYVFNATTGAPVATLNNPVPVANDRFGAAVAIFGNTAVVGANLLDVALEGSGGGLGGAGVAYLFDAASGALTATLNNPTPQPYEYFGAAVAISGNLVLAGALMDSPGGLSQAGSAYVFGCPASTPTDTPADTPTATPSGTPTPVPQCPSEAIRITIANPAPEVNDNFGRSVATSGNIVVVGAPEDNPGGVDGAGSAYVFDAATGALVVTLNNPDPAVDDRFGSSVAISGNLAVVGSYYDSPGGVQNGGSAHVFNATTGALTATLNNPEPTDYDYFGYSVAIDGNMAVVGAFYDGGPGGLFGSGTAYVFDVATGALVATLNNPDPAADDWFGDAVAISGNVALVAASGDDPGKLIDAGTVYAFNAATGALLTTLNSPNPVSGRFGRSVAISGGLAVVGADGDGSFGTADIGTAHVFDVVTGELATKLIRPAPEYYDFFGGSVAISGNVAVVGAYYDNYGEGAAFVFNAATGELTDTLREPLPPGGERFGASVAISGNVTVVGKPVTAEDDPDFAGTAYIFTCGPATPTSTPTPTPSPSPTPVPTVIGTPVVSFDIVIGYRPANDHGRGFVEFTDSDPSPDLRSYIIEFRRTNRFGVIFQGVFSLDAPPGASETRSTEFDLPLNIAENPLSYEADLQYRVVGFTGPAGTGIALYQSPLAFAKHPSATLDASITLTSPPIAPGSEPFAMSDARPTAQIGTVQYEIVRTVPGVEGETVLAVLDHGYPGPADVARVWPAVVRTGAIPVVAGPQVLRVCARRDYFDSAGAPLGRFEFAPPSPPLALGDIGPLSARIAEYLRTGAGDSAGLDLNADGMVDVADLLFALTTGQ